MAPFTDCGRRDPWADRPHAELNAASCAAAVAHLDRNGLTGIAPVSSLRPAWAEALTPGERAALMRVAHHAQAAQAAPTITPGSSRWPGPNLPTTGGPSL